MLKEALFRLQIARRLHNHSFAARANRLPY